MNYWLLFLMLFTLNGCLAHWPDKLASLSFSAKEEVGAKKADELKDYGYNLPHKVPNDYVYRTERIFSLPARLHTVDDQESAIQSEGRQGALAFNDQTAALAHALMSGYEVEEEQRIIVTTFVNLNNLYATSGLGRLLAEGLTTSFRQAGINIVEIRKTPSLLVREKFGEYGLSRDMEEIPFVQNADAIVAGTYKEAGGQVFVNARLIRNADGKVLSAAAMLLEKDAVVTDLLADEKAPSTRKALPLTVSAEK